MNECEAQPFAPSERQSSDEIQPEFFGEGGSFYERISLQHFPMSTSSRSFCDSSTDEKKSKQTTTPIDSSVEQKEATVSSTEYPITKTISQLNSMHYLKIRHVFEFFNFMIGHLVCNEPEDPVEFLVDLLDKCLKFRDGDPDQYPPLLFTPIHVESLYNAFDPFKRGSVSYSQYEEAMKTLGLTRSITPYNRRPSLDDKDHVKEATFKTEANRCILENFKQMIRKPKKREENRLVWTKRMAENPKTSHDWLSSAEEENLGEDEEEFDGYFCRCPNIKRALNKTMAPCPTPQNTARHEPEQLYLNT